MTSEKPVSPLSGYSILVLVFLLIAGGIAGAFLVNLLFILLIALAVVLSFGFFFQNPNDSVVLVLLGKYIGTVKTNGFWWVNPFFTKRHISLRARNFDSEKIKVNDKV